MLSTFILSLSFILFIHHYFRYRYVHIHSSHSPTPHSFLSFIFLHSPFIYSSIHLSPLPPFTHVLIHLFIRALIHRIFKLLFLQKQIGAYKAPFKICVSRSHIAAYLKGSATRANLAHLKKNVLCG